eukprot:2615241-Prymnesium_polylepis.3
MPRGASVHCSPWQLAVGLLEPAVSAPSCPHSEQAELPAGEYVPSAHTSHFSVFASGANVPAAQRRHPSNLASSSAHALGEACFVRVDTGHMGVSRQDRDWPACQRRSRTSAHRPWELDPRGSSRVTAGSEQSALRLAPVPTESRPDHAIPSRERGTAHRQGARCRRRRRGPFAHLKCARDLPQTFACPLVAEALG